MAVEIINADFRTLSISIDGRPFFDVRKALCSVSEGGGFVIFRWGLVEDRVAAKQNYVQRFTFLTCIAPVAVSNTDLVNQIRIMLNNATAIAADASLLNGQPGTFYLNRANHSGTQLASTISDFGTAVQLQQLRFQKITLSSGLINGSNTVFVWAQPPSQIFWNGQKLVRNRISNGYTLSGNTSTHTEAPEVGDDVEAYGEY